MTIKLIERGETGKKKFVPDMLKRSRINIVRLPSVVTRKIVRWHDKIPVALLPVFDLRTLFPNSESHFAPTRTESALLYFPLFCYPISMSYIIVGLGNPGKEYEDSRHNAGRMVVEALGKKLELKAWREDKKLNALKAEVKIGKEKVTLLLPEGMMNNSGASVKSLITSVKKAEQLVVVHDDLDLPLGRIKLSFNRSAGGHRGVASVVKNIKTEQFLRVRVGVCGKRKPVDVVDFILKPFKTHEELTLKKTIKKTVEALVCVVEEGKDRAMNIYNS
jgi:PTH1 family peptidyl-tRNA hydrolase